MLNNLINAMEHAIREVRQMPEKTVQVFHHNDADGLTSGAILTRAFERQGFKVQRFSLEKPYPAVLKKIYEQEGKDSYLCRFCRQDRADAFRLEQGKKSDADSGSPCR